MEVKYICEYCGNTYNSQDKCKEHEDKCREKEAIRISKIKEKLNKLIMGNKNPCDYCENSYYIYGCEINCMEKCRKYNKFVPVKPFHDKSKNGGV